MRRHFTTELQQEQSRSGFIYKVDPLPQVAGQPRKAVWQELAAAAIILMVGLSPTYTARLMLPDASPELWSRRWP